MMNRVIQIAFTLALWYPFAVTILALKIRRLRRELVTAKSGAKKG
jgi:hypothetical protein